MAERIRALELEVKDHKITLEKVEQMRTMFLDILSTCEEFETRVSLIEAKSKECVEKLSKSKTENSDQIVNALVSLQDRTQKLENNSNQFESKIEIIGNCESKLAALEEKYTAFESTSKMLENKFEKVESSESRVGYYKRLLEERLKSCQEDVELARTSSANNEKLIQYLTRKTSKLEGQTWDMGRKLETIAVLNCTMEIEMGIKRSAENPKDECNEKDVIDSISTLKEESKLTEKATSKSTPSSPPPSLSSSTCHTMATTQPATQPIFLPYPPLPRPPLPHMAPLSLCPIWPTTPQPRAYYPPQYISYNPTTSTAPAPPPPSFTATSPDPAKVASCEVIPVVTVCDRILKTEVEKVVGREGCLIDWVRKTSQAMVIISQNYFLETHFLVTYSGTQEQVTKAQELVESIHQGIINEKNINKYVFKHR